MIFFLEPHQNLPLIREVCIHPPILPPKKGAPIANIISTIKKITNKHGSKTFNACIYFQKHYQCSKEYSELTKEATTVAKSLYAPVQMECQREKRNI